MIWKYLAAGSGAAAMLFAGLLVFEMRSSGRLALENGDLRAQITTCNARVANITEDKQSDATVTDPADFDIPDHWMRPAPADH